MTECQQFSCGCVTKCQCRYNRMIGTALNDIDNVLVIWLRHLSFP